MSNRSKSIEDDRAVPRLLSELGTHFDPRTGWVLLTRDRRGAISVFSNRRPDKFRALIRAYLEQKRDQR